MAVATAHRSDCGGTEEPPSPISSSTLAPASACAAAVCIAASSACAAPTLLSYYATFAASLVCLARAAWPGRIDAALAIARQAASRARADLEADLRRLRDAAGRARPEAAQRFARLACATVARWRRRWEEHSHSDATRAARFVLRLAALVARLAATVVFDAACDEARDWAPSVLAYLRRVVDRITPPSLPPSASCSKGGDEAAAGGFVLKDVVRLVGTGFYLLFTTHLLFSSSAASGMQFCAVCFAATCGLTMLIADWIDPLDDDDADEETDTTAAAVTDGSSRPEGDAGAGRDEELEVRESWRFLWVLTLITYCVDAFLLHVTLGPQPTTLAVLALCNFEVLKVGRQVQLTPENVGEGATAEGSAQGGGVDKWRRGAMVVYAACSVKILVVYLVLDCCKAALGFLWLFVMADLLLAEEDNLSDFDAASGEGEGDGEDEDEEESAGFEEDGITGGAEGERENESSAHCDRDDSSSEDENESFARCDRDDGSSEDEVESSVHCESSEQREIVDEEQQDEEPDYGSGGSSTDDSWDLVDVDDPEMPAAKANCGTNRRKSRLFPWKHAA